MNMNDHTNNEYREIRLLLARYYDGTASQAETRRLEEFFAQCADLPADLEADRALFEAMAGIACEPVEIPAGLSSRIDAALEAEMARDRMADADESSGTAGAAAAPRHGVWRRRLLTAVAAAACLAAAVTTVRTLMYVPDISDSPRNEAIASAADSARMNASLASAADAQAVDAQAVDTVAPAIAPTGLTARAEKPAPAAARKKAARKARAVTAPEVDGDDSPDVIESERYPAEMYAASGYEAEEERLIAANYHVVDDEREAYAIVNSIFSRLEGNMMREDNRLDDIGDSYEMEMTRISY